MGIVESKKTSISENQGKGIVKVQTWGTSPDGGSGLMNFLSTQYRGENVGHASLEIRLPDSPENSELIKKYCYQDPEIPVERKMRKKDDGTEEAEYIVRFSFIPGKKSPFHLNFSYSDDTIYERAGHHTTERHYLEVSELEERRGSKRVISVFPACSLTEKGRALDFSTPQGQYILKVKEIENCNDLLETAKLLEKKYNALKENKKTVDLDHPSNKTILIAAKRLGIELPKGKFSLEELDNMLNVSEIKKNVQDKIAQLNKEKLVLMDKIDQREKKEENKQLVTALNDILKKLNDSNLDILPSEIEKLKIPEEIKNELLKLTELNELGQLKVKLENLREQCIKENERFSIESLTFFNNKDDYLCRGRPADGEIQLPLGAGENELNAAAMLEQMRKIVDSGYDYDLYTHNCSSTALSILKAGRDGAVSEVSPARGFTTTNPQTVYNEAIALRDKVCKVSAPQSLSNLDDFYASRTLGTKVIPRECSNVHEAILSFAVDNIFPEDEDITNKTFYVFSKSDRESILKHQDKLIPTDLLRDLWGIIPNRTLPLSKDGANNVVIDRNMTIGQLMQGLSILAQKNAETRLTKQDALIESNENDPYKILRDKIESEIMRLGNRTDQKSVKKTTDLTEAYINTVERLNSINPPLSNKERAALLFEELTPQLKVNTGFNFYEATSYAEVKKTAIELGVCEKTDYTNKFRNIVHEMREKCEQTKLEITEEQQSLFSPK
ncbi:hypothetical protein [Legionella cincinnatiensis]|uniref:Protein SidG n=1 Tax=Legionella cincinnatiensis TaxID=28085 RepID=A0A378IHN1_9GAMM|nr:hypothetical protein [Legionella cincinnatiensis]KTC81967.1 SidG protein, substrate of the Dot/Icm system [Legionella cincinnatiensis]STX34748.1 protein SidG [Legionella cincinnatiensis]